ncbi:MAG: DUF1549 domain-containing protein [Verrucomicrobiales bacterium]|nr:DUF1549 domain-containing protein [Verrucomicrobiales bacterium]
MRSRPIGTMGRRLAGLLAGCLLAWTPLLSHAELRQWTDQDGRSVEAEYIKVEAGQVHLRLPDARVVPFPFARLSAADQEYVRKLFKLSPASLAAEVDALVNKKLAAEKVTPNPRTTDEQFVRRAYLEITGTIPNFNQTLDFLESTDPEKRRKLVDTLLDSPGYVSHSFNWYADLLRLVSRTNDFYIFEHYLDWVKESIRENKPYDQFVRELVTAEGRMWDDPAAGYFIRDRGMALGNLATTVTIFLGTEITCAECHDHPFEDWTQMDFYSLAAFLGQRQDRIYGKEWGEKLTRERGRIEAEQRKRDPSLGPEGYVQPFRLVISANEQQVWDDPQKALKLPNTYKYDDGKPGDLVEPRTLFGDPVDISKYESPRHAFAAWLTAKENPMFAKTAVNRLWKRAFGLALHEPMGNVQDIQKSQNPELFTFLESAFKDLNFNVKEMLRAIYYTEAWQRQATLEGPTLVEVEGNRYHFPGPVLKRMSSQQLWDSFLTLTLPDPMRFKRDVSGPLTELIKFEVENITGEDSVRRLEALNQLMSRTIYNGAPSLELWREESTATDTETDSYLKFSGSYLARASELPQPAPSGHFLRAWGQGDRSLVDGASDNGSIPQILTMINGPFTQMLIKPDSLIFKTAGGERGTGDKMEKIFLSILNRYPQGKEKAICSRAIRSDDEGYGDLIWALVNTREFLFIR